MASHYTLRVNTSRGGWDLVADDTSLSVNHFISKAEADRELPAVLHKGGTVKVLSGIGAVREQLIFPARRKA